MAESISSHPRVFFATVDRIEEYHAVLALDNKETCILPLACMPDETAEGDRVRITCERAQPETSARMREAKELLNDLLNSNHSS